MSIVRISSKGKMVNSKSSEDNSLSSGGMQLPSSDLCRCVTFGGSSDSGKLFIPSSNFACLAIFTCSVSKSNHRMLRVVFGMKPRNIPLRELLQNFAGRGVEGRTHTLQPNVRKFRNFSVGNNFNWGFSLTASNEGL